MHSIFDKKHNTNKALIESIILEQYNQYYRLAYSYVHNEADACDIVQTGAYKAIRNCYTLNQPEFAQTWVYRIMLNECFAFIRKPKALSYDAMQDEGMESAYTEEHDRDIDLQRAIDSLPEKDKAIILLRYFEDKKIEEIADILNENTNTIKSRLYRSMSKLRVALTDNKKQYKKIL